MNQDKEFALTMQMIHDEELARARDGNLLSFTMLTKSNYEVNWHHQLTAKYLTRFVQRKIRRLMIFQPPRHGKSELASRRTPALIHGMYPDDEILAASYNNDLAADNTIDVQRIIDRPEYAEIFPNSRITPEGTMSKYARSKNEHELIPIQHPDRLWSFPQGSYRSAGVGGAFTGRGGKWVLIDDPVKNREDADSRSFRETLWGFYSSTLRTRLEGEGSILVMMTRWHADDLAGRLVRLMKSEPDSDQWVILNLPALREDMENAEDPRNIGDPLWPNKFDDRQLKAIRANNERDWAALYQQRPTTEGGNIIKSDWIKYYDALPQKFDEVLLSADMAVKDKKGSDFNVIQIWGRLGVMYFLIHQMRGRWAFPTTCEKFAECCRLYPSAGRKLIEAKASGPAVFQTLRSKIPGLIEVEPRGDKVARVHSITHLYQGGNVWYPNPRNAPWISDHIIELTDFPNGVNDDQVDAATQALDNLRSRTKLFMPIAGGHGVVF